MFYALIMGAILLLAIVLGGLAGLKFAKNFVNRFTDTKPMPLPEARLSRAEIDQLEARVEKFHQAVHLHRVTEPLALTADEVNALISTDSRLTPLKNRVYVSIVGTQLRAQISVPVEDLGLGALRGRYINAAAALNISLRNGLLYVEPETISVRDKALPENIMKQIRIKNLAGYLNSDASASNALHRLQDIQVKDGKIVIVPKSS